MSVSCVRQQPWHPIVLTARPAVASMESINVLLQMYVHKPNVCTERAQSSDTMTAQKEQVLPSAIPAEECTIKNSAPIHDHQLMPQRHSCKVEHLEHMITALCEAYGPHVAVYALASLRQDLLHAVCDC